MTVTIKGFTLPMGTFFGSTDDGRVFLGKVDPSTKEVLELHQIEIPKEIPNTITVEKITRVIESGS